jgi:hypothetical protein
MKYQYFAHRPPSVGIHLLSDPLPKRSISICTESQALTSSKRQAAQTKMKKPDLRT